jgi:hypothetical protein
VERGLVVPHPATVAALDRALTNAERAAKRGSDQNDHEPAGGELVEKVRDVAAQPSG